MTIVLVILVSMMPAMQIKPIGAQNTIIVPDDYPTVQAAINAANPSDTIYVRANTYYENVVIDKPISLVGEDKHATVIDGNNKGTVVQITADNVTVSNFKIQNSEWHWSESGIAIRGELLRDTTNVHIKDNILTHNYGAITLMGAAYNKIAGNTILENKQSIVLASGYGTGPSHDNLVLENTIENNEYGIHLSEEVRGNFIYANTITNVEMPNLELWRAPDNVVARNTITLYHDVSGILVSDFSNNSIIYWNTIESVWTIWKAGTGISIYGSYDCHVFNNNFINLKQPAYMDVSIVSWDDGYPSGGNYWSDYTGVDHFSGPNQDQPGSDGIGDAPYIIAGDVQDNYPLIYPETRFRPIPTLVSVDYPHRIQIGEWATITVTAINYGESAEWQTIHVGFPDNPPLENIEILSHDLNGGAKNYTPGTELPAAYGDYTIISEYVMVESVHGPWETGETHTMTVKVNPENSETFTFYVKTVNRAEGVTYYDSTSVTDQQDEYVYLYEIYIRSTHPDLVEGYFPYFIFDEEEKYYPTSFYHDDTDITNNPSNYDKSWPYSIYIHTVETEDYLCIQYWMYYCKDDKLGLKVPLIGAHDHDWESVYVYLEKQDGSYSLAFVTYFRHMMFDDLKLVEFFATCSKTVEMMGTHPIVHVARDSHASYEKTTYGYGIFVTEVPTGLPIIAIEPCDGGLELDYDDFQIIYVDDTDFWPQQFGTVDAPWVRERWNWDDPVFPSPVVKFSMLSLHEAGSKLYLHILDNQSRHVGFNNETSEIEVEIPGAYYEDSGNTTFIILPENITDFEVTVDGQYAHEPVETYELVISTVKDGELVDETPPIEKTIEQGKSQHFNVKLDPSGKITIEEIPIEEPDQAPEDNTPLFILTGIVVISMVMALTIVVWRRRKEPK